MCKLFCLKCNQYTDNKNANISHTTNGKTMISAYCYHCNGKKSRFIKEQAVIELLSMFTITIIIFI